jgi:hypothetical protein
MFAFLLQSNLCARLHIKAASLYNSCQGALSSEPGTNNQAQADGLQEWAN